MASYEWKNIKTNEVIDHDHYSNPPDGSGNWQRVYSFGLSAVAASPARQSVKKHV